MSTPQTKLPGGGQFRLVKFFAYACFIILALFSFPFSVVISQNAKDMLMRSYENQAYFVGENLNHQVFQNFVIPVTSRYGKISLRESAQYDLMDRVVKNTIHGFNVELVNIYAITQGVIAYSTDPQLIGKKVQESIGYKKAVRGEHFSGLLSEKDDLWGLGIDRMGGRKRLRTFIPLKGFVSFADDSGTVFGVFEIIQDLSSEYRSIVRFQYLIFGLSILIMGLIFLALLLVVRKAERTIEERARERRELEAQLHQAERLAALGQMCAGVSHEIRNPLGIIRSTAEQLRSCSTGQEMQKVLSDVIIEESDRLNNVVTDFLDFARPHEPQFRDCDLGEIIRKNLTFLETELAKKKIAVRTDLDGRSLRLQGDPDLLYRGFLNIFLNAIQAMEEGGRLEVTVSEEKDHYLVGVQDTGCGIGEENLRRIFDPFFTTRHKGTGLGLSIVRNIVECHRGNVWIESKEGAFTRVLLRLPR
ncbi:MAG: GHKL domain-containing protein [Deltaproteobacteria bacterium]|nr:GHKL domain-containing protein [Deltaproteobacteria bacterium]MBW1950835.1 GHKL domain-containing protein [Deltaproteobacteria bacterium]MBW2008807.1 GHKL domain-containing protein [Deltaproteobacteria bacterium]MBW2103279.1 GHKL domain-containing protein [Deltaproteobacteria bacterium]MBW2348960.1 GHKL domain-containing protein [Deltaproteobacteria bacterium]